MDAEDGGFLETDQTMTIGITGPRPRARRRRAVITLIIAAIVVTICLILLGLTSDLLVDWLWFSAIGYLYVFWTTIGGQVGVFFAVFVATGLSASMPEKSSSDGTVLALSERRRTTNAAREPTS